VQAFWACQSCSGRGGGWWTFRSHVLQSFDCFDLFLPPNVGLTMCLVARKRNVERQLAKKESAVC
jgi:hypothetical protein